jgi:hypothetical protein
MNKSIREGLDGDERLTDKKNKIVDDILKIFKVS